MANALLYLDVLQAWIRMLILTACCGASWWGKTIYQIERRHFLEALNLIQALF
jgi:hypothetical protein